MHPLSVHFTGHELRQDFARDYTPQNDDRITAARRSVNRHFVVLAKVARSANQNLILTVAFNIDTKKCA